jgi:hypothetical protein
VDLTSYLYIKNGSNRRISDFLESLYKVFIPKPFKIISLSFTIFLVLPIIKWFLSTVIYITKPTAENLDKFTITIFVDNIIPWYFGILIEPLNSLVIFLIITFLVTLGFYLKENS